MLKSLLFKKYIFYFFPHLLASGDPDCWSNCHGNQPGQAWTYEIEHLQDCCEEAEEEHNHVEEKEGDEASVEGDKLSTMMVEAV